MHKKEYIQLLNESAQSLDISIEHFSDNWAVRLRKNNQVHYIIGYTFPLNNSASYKIARNKNLCTEILNFNNIPCVPHQLVLSPKVLKRRKKEIGNRETIQKFLAENKYPILIKKNNSSSGLGVYLVKNEAELEDTLSKVYRSEATLCLSPYRKNIKEYRNIILNGECLLSYEKKIPCIHGDGKKTILELLNDYKINNETDVLTKRIFDESILDKMYEVPQLNEEVPLRWKHNTGFGTAYSINECKELKDLAIRAAKCIDAKFVSVDIFHSDKFGYEILEINASVVLHSFPNVDKSNYNIALNIYKKAIENTFNLS